jgi:glyoxylase-like metal-dependent hydrolase (beta-lactamase superfamily II)
MSGTPLSIRQLAAPTFVLACTCAVAAARPSGVDVPGARAAATLSVALPTRLAPGVDLLPGRFVPNVQPDGNTVVLRAPKGLIVVDTGRHPEHTQAILDLAARGRARVAAVVNTHWHLDHVGGNPMLRKRYPEARVYASGALAGALKGFLADYRAQLQAMIDKTADARAQEPWRAELAIIDSGPALGPDEVVAASGERTIAGRRLKLGLESHAVTAGDVWLFDPGTRVLAAGDLVTLPVPFFDTACPSGWQAALGNLDAIDFALLVPGHGAPMERKQFETYRSAFDRLLSCAASQREREECIAGWVRDAATLLTTEDPAFVRSLTGYYVDQLRADPARLARLCAG